MQQNIVLSSTKMGLCGCPDACSMTATMPVCFPVQISFRSFGCLFAWKKVMISCLSPRIDLMLRKCSWCHRFWNSLKWSFRILDLFNFACVVFWYMYKFCWGDLDAFLQGKYLWFPARAMTCNNLTESEC